MFDRIREHAPGHSTAADHDAPGVPGRRTLTEELPRTPAEPRDEPPSAFEGARWEAIDPGELAASERDDDDSLPARRAAAPPAGAPQAAAGSDPHAAPYEGRASRASRYFAPEDEYNPEHIVDQRMHSTSHVGRPGVRVGSERRGKDLFRLAVPLARRYLVVFRGGRYVAEPFDEVHAHELTAVNYKFFKDPAKRKPPAGKRRLLLNPAAPRKLLIEGKSADCVLTWLQGRGAAWMAARDLVVPGLAPSASDDAILRATRREARASRPKRPPTTGLTQYQFRPAHDPIGHADAVDLGPASPSGKHEQRRKLAPNDGDGGNDVSHYLGKTQTKTLTQTDGTQVKAERTFYPVCQSLPQPDAATVATDTATERDVFFVPAGAEFRREVGIYEPNRQRTALRQTWVYGFLGRLEPTPGGKEEWRPDRSRYGWVPLRVLAPTPAPTPPSTPP